MKIYFTLGIKNEEKEEYLREVYGDDCFTDDIGNAILFERIHELPNLNMGEYLVRVVEDEEGGLYVAQTWENDRISYEEKWFQLFNVAKCASTNEKMNIEEKYIWEQIRIRMEALEAMGKIKAQA